LHGGGGVLTGARAEEELLARLGAWPPARHGGEQNDPGPGGLLEDPAVQYRDLMEQLREAESKLPGLEAKHEAALAAEARAPEIERLARETESRLATVEAVFDAMHKRVATRTLLARELEALDEESETTDGATPDPSRRHERAARRAVVRDQLAALRRMVPDALLASRHASALAELGPVHTIARNAAAELDAVEPQLLRGEVLRAQGAIATCKRRVRELHEKAQARVMARDRRPFPLILDDTRGWTDDGQFLSMVQILRDASSELQIILLTCHPAGFNRFQAEYSVDLDQLRDARESA
jgi:hypothetical protein